MEGDNKHDKLLGIIGSKTARSNTVTLENTSEQVYERERSKIVQEDLDTLILLVEHLQIEHDNVGREDNEYKTRYDNQAELNEYHESSIAEMRKQKVKLQNGTGQFNDKDNAELKKLVIDLQRHKTTLESQLKDLEWRLDQEAKAYYKADEKRKALQKDAARKHYKVLDEQLKLIDKDRDKKLKALERGQPKDFSPRVHREAARAVPEKPVVEEHFKQQKIQPIPREKDGRPYSFGPKKNTVRSTTTDSGPSSSVTDTPTDKRSPQARRKAVLRETNRRSLDDGVLDPDAKPHNIKLDKRILDPKQGPIRRTAATRQLPKFRNP